MVLVIFWSAALVSLGADEGIVQILLVAMAPWSVHGTWVLSRYCCRMSSDRSSCVNADASCVVRTWGISCFSDLLACIEGGSLTDHRGRASEPLACPQPMAQQL